MFPIRNVAKARLSKSITFDVGINSRREAPEVHGSGGVYAGRFAGEIGKAR